MGGGEGDGVGGVVSEIEPASFFPTPFFTPGSGSRRDINHALWSLTVLITVKLNFDTCLFNGAFFF